MMSDNQAQTISIERAAEILGVGRDAVRAGIRDGHIPSIRAGKHIKVPLPALESMLRGENQHDESEIARQVQLMGLRSALKQIDVQREELVRQISEIESADRLTTWLKFLGEVPESGE
ncbi:MAG: excisionase family DNA-binding protein [Armatimonadota bacterium]|nr:excisionase family DNA-binding protein [bacterium]